MSLLTASRPVMEWLVEETAESVFLSVLDGTEALNVDTRESPRSVRLFGQVGRRVPLYAGGTPKILFAFLPEETRSTLLKTVELKPITPYTLTDSSRLEELLLQIRQQGYVVTADDLDVGAHSIAAPIRNYQGQVVAAISVAGPSHRFTELSRPGCGRYFGGRPISSLHRRVHQILHKACTQGCNPNLWCPWFQGERE
jgi:IclR family KDG regulon transcriptional repressor